MKETLKELEADLENKNFSDVEGDTTFKLPYLKEQKSKCRSGGTVDTLVLGTSAL